MTQYSFSQVVSCCSAGGGLVIVHMKEEKPLDVILEFEDTSTEAKVGWWMMERASTRLGSPAPMSGRHAP